MILVDAYGAGNSRSSSGGESRIIRSSYGADEIYARWAWRSLALWKQFFAETGEAGLFYPAGVLWTAPAGDPRVAANEQALTDCGVAFESLTQAEIEKRYPQIRFSWPVTGVFEPQAGALLARRCVQAVVREAVRSGVEFIRASGEPPSGAPRMSNIDIGPGEQIAAGTFIYACGPWLPKTFPSLLKDRIWPTRQEVFFFGTGPSDSQYSPPAMPVWLDYTDPRGGYTIPELESRGFKLAFDIHGPAADPDTQVRVVSPESMEHARGFIRERFPGLADAPVIETRVCQYENTSNGDFLIDRHPAYENVWIAGGGSGHGFKHGPAVGEYVDGILSGTVRPEPRFALATKATAPARSVY